MHVNPSERGFTLIEMLTVILILSILIGLGITTLRTYRATASNGVATASVRDAITDVEGALNNVDQTYALVTFDQNTPGPLLDPGARTALSTFAIPKNLAFHVEFDQSCDNAACTQIFLQARHCFGNSNVQYMRSGDGISLFMETSGGGC